MRNVLSHTWPLLLAVAVSADLAVAQILNRNLVVNGGAEDGSGASSPSAPQVASIPGWTVTGGFSVGSYGASDFLSAGDFGPSDRGKQFFFGGRGTARSSASQTIDLSAASGDIDAGKVKFSLDGYLGLLAGSIDKIGTISLTADFQDASGAVLLHASAPGPDPSDVHI